MENNGVKTQKRVSMSPAVIARRKGALKRLEDRHREICIALNKNEFPARPSSETKSNGWRPDILWEKVDFEKQKVRVEKEISTLRTRIV